MRAGGDRRGRGETARGGRHGSGGTERPLAGRHVGREDSPGSSRPGRRTRRCSDSDCSPARGSSCSARSACGRSSLPSRSSSSRRPPPVPRSSPGPRTPWRVSHCPSPCPRGTFSLHRQMRCLTPGPAVAAHADLPTGRPSGHPPYRGSSRSMFQCLATVTIQRAVSAGEHGEEGHGALSRLRGRRTGCRRRGRGGCESPPRFRRTGAPPGRASRPAKSRRRRRGRRDLASGA